MVHRKPTSADNHQQVPRRSAIGKKLRRHLRMRNGRGGESKECGGSRVTACSKMFRNDAVMFGSEVWAGKKYFEYGKYFATKSPVGNRFSYLFIDI